MTAHRFGSLRSFVYRFPVGTRAVALLGIKEQEREVVIRGPVREESTMINGYRVKIRFVTVHVAGETSLREIAAERLIAALL
jgi:hypothetical protein